MCFRIYVCVLKCLCLNECEVLYKMQAKGLCVFTTGQFMTSWTEGQRGEKIPHCEILVGNSVNHQITTYLNKGHIVGEAVAPTA